MKRKKIQVYCVLLILLLVFSSCTYAKKEYAFQYGSITLSSSFHIVDTGEVHYNPTLLGQSTARNNTSCFSDGKELICITTYSGTFADLAQNADQKTMLEWCMLKTTLSDSQWAKKHDEMSEVVSEGGEYFYHFLWKDYSREVPLTVFYVTCVSDGEQFHVISYETVERDREKGSAVFLDLIRSICFSGGGFAE